MLSRVSSFSGPMAKLFRKSIDSYSFTTQNMILYLDAGQTASYPGTGTTWSDLSVQDNDATSLYNVTYSSGYLTFNGLDSQGALTSSKYNVTYSGKTVFISAYLAEHMGNNVFRGILGSSAGNRNFNFYLNRDGSGNYRLHFSSGGAGDFSGNIAVTPGTWFTAGFTHTTAGLVTYYFNGVAAGTFTQTFFQYLAGSTEHVGRTDNYWYGRLGVVAVYKAALSASEILGNHRSTITTDGFTYANFASTTGLALVSTDGVIANALYVTNTTGGTGNVYRSTSIRYNRSFSFQWVFECSGGTGADGFCLQWTPTNDSNGALGGGVSLIATAVNAITFLTYANNNVTWYKNNVSQGAQAQTLGVNSFRQNVYYWFDYDHALSTGKVYYSTSSTKPGSAQHSYTSFTFDSSNYYIGIGAATGGSTDNHILKSMTLTF